MAAAAYLADALMAKWASMTFTGKPDLWPDGPPLKDDAGAAVNPPFVAFFTDDVGSTVDAVGMDIETVLVRFEVYATTKAAARDIARGVQYDAGGPGDREGMDDPTALTLGGGLSLNAMWRTGPGSVTEAPHPSLAGETVFRVVLPYTCELITDSA